MYRRWQVVAVININGRISEVPVTNPTDEYNARRLYASYQSVTGPEDFVRYAMRPVE